MPPSEPIRPDAAADASAGQAAPWIEATGLDLQRGNQGLLHGIRLSIGAGLTLVRGGEQRGKTSLLQVLTGELEPTGGRIVRRTQRVFRADRRDPRDDALSITDWWQQASGTLGGLNTALAHDLADALGLQEHLHKPLYMLSTGSRRKAAYVLAFATQADVALLDVPFASLDARSCEVLRELLSEASEHAARAWVVADYEPLPGLPMVAYRAVIDLGD